MRGDCHKATLRIEAPPQLHHEDDTFIASPRFQGAARGVLAMGRILRVVLLSCVSFVPSWGAADAIAAEGVSAADQRKTCTYYERRARVQARQGREGFPDALARACEDALASLDSEDPTRAGERAAAHAFLGRLVSLRRTISAMNLARIEAGENSIILLPKQIGGALRGIPQVSAAGEFLIAHRMGLISALDAWVEARANVALAER